MTFSVSDSEAPTATWHEGTLVCQSGMGRNDTCADTWYAQATASGADIVSITESGSDYGVLHYDIEEWSGMSGPYAATSNGELCDSSCTGSESTPPTSFPGSAYVAFAAPDSATGGLQIYSPGTSFTLDTYDESAVWEYSTSVTSPTIFPMSLSGTTYDTWVDSGIVVYSTHPASTTITLNPSSGLGGTAVTILGAGFL